VGGRWKEILISILSCVLVSVEKRGKWCLPAVETLMRVSSASWGVCVAIDASSLLLGDCSRSCRRYSKTVRRFGAVVFSTASELRAILLRVNSSETAGQSRSDQAGVVRKIVRDVNVVSTQPPQVYYAEMTVRGRRANDSPIKEFWKRQPFSLES
jgi:hypothetical protein